MKSSGLLLAFFLWAVNITAQPSVETFMRIPIGMLSKDALNIFHKEWTSTTEYTTDIWTTYAVGGSVEEGVPGSFRFLLYYYGDFIAEKELRISVPADGARKLFDSVRNRMTQVYGKPLKDSVVSYAGVHGPARYISWNFPKAGIKEIYRLDIAVYKLSTRKDYTVQLVAFNLGYMTLMDVKDNDYLHLISR